MNCATQSVAQILLILTNKIEILLPSFFHQIVLFKRFCVICLNEILAFDLSKTYLFEKKDHINRAVLKNLNRSAAIPLERKVKNNHVSSLLLAVKLVKISLKTVSCMNSLKSTLR